MSFDEGMIPHRGIETPLKTALTAAVTRLMQVLSLPVRHRGDLSLGGVNRVGGGRSYSPRLFYRTMGIGQHSLN